MEANGDRPSELTLGDGCGCSLMLAARCSMLARAGLRQLPGRGESFLIVGKERKTALGPLNPLP